MIIDNCVLFKYYKLYHFFLLLYYINIIINYYNDIIVKTQNK